MIVDRIFTRFTALVFGEHSPRRIPDVVAGATPAGATRQRYGRVPPGTKSSANGAPHNQPRATPEEGETFQSLALKARFISPLRKKSLKGRKILLLTIELRSKAIELLPISPTVPGIYQLQFKCALTLALTPFALRRPFRKSAGNAGPFDLPKHALGDRRIGSFFHVHDSSQQFLGDLDRKLWTAADPLRVNLDAAVFKHALLGLIFLKYVSDSKHEQRHEQSTSKGDSPEWR